MESKLAIRSFLSVRLPQFVTGHLLTFLTQDDILQFFEAIMTLFLSGGRFTSKAKHIIEDPLRSHLLTYFKLKFKNMTSALPAFFKLNKVYREVLFGNRTLLIDYLHIPVKSRTKFLSFSHCMLESKLLESIQQRNLIVYNTQYLPYLDKVIHKNNQDEKDWSFQGKMKFNIRNDYVSRFTNILNSKNYFANLSQHASISIDFYDNFDSKFEEYKQKLKESFYLPIDFEPSSQTQTETKYTKRTTQVGHIETSVKTIVEQLQQRQKEYEEKLQAEKLKKLREERERMKKREKIDKTKTNKTKTNKTKTPKKKTR